MHIQELNIMDVKNELTNKLLALEELLGHLQKKTRKQELLVNSGCSLIELNQILADVHSRIDYFYTLNTKINLIIYQIENHYLKNDNDLLELYNGYKALSEVIIERIINYLSLKINIKLYLTNELN